MALINRRSNKTDSVMKLIMGNRSPNPIIDKEFKEDIIRPIEEQKTRAAISAAVPEAHSDPTEMNITAELISGWLSPVLERFGCCRCSRCIAEASVTAFERLPVIRVKVQNNDDLEKARRIKEENKSKAIMVLIGIASERRKLPSHKR